MVDAQTVDLAVSKQSQNQVVSRVEDLRILRADRGEIVDVEKTAIVDLLGGDAPVSRAVSLLLEQLIEAIEAVPVADAAIE